MPFFNEGERKFAVSVFNFIVVFQGNVTLNLLVIISVYVAFALSFQLKPFSAVRNIKRFKEEGASAHY